MQPGSRTLEVEVRRFVYERVLHGGTPPSRDEIAAATHASREATLEALEQLAAARVLVLQPHTREILMAPPFSAVPTSFAVDCGRFTAFGNCIWDALGIAAMLQQNAAVRTSCGDCGMAMEVRVETSAVRGEGILHFGVPARDWWKDIVFS